jgi:hypothetical protein
MRSETPADADEVCTRRLSVNAARPVTTVQKASPASQAALLTLLPFAKEAFAASASSSIQRFLARCGYFVVIGFQANANRTIVCLSCAHLCDIILACRCHGARLSGTDSQWHHRKHGEQV